MLINMTPRLKRCIINCLNLILLTLILIYVLSIRRIYKMETKYQPANCFLNKNELDDSLGIPLEDVLLSEVEPIIESTIFFIDTSCPSNGNILELTARQACAIESAAFNNDIYQIFVLFASPRYQQQEGKRHPLIDAILSYPNVQLRQVNLMRYAAGTPIEDWLKKGELFKSSYLSTHLADVLRLLTLYRFGGICVHLDTMILNTVTVLPLNYAGADLDNQISTAMLSLTSTGFGHQFAGDCLRDLQQSFDANNRHTSGRDVITRALQRACGTFNVAEMRNNPKGCQSFQLYNHTQFLPIKPADWRQLFEEEFLDEVLQQTRGVSFMLHLWHSKSHKERIKRGTKAAYTQYARRHCPKAYAAAGEYF
ncbi:lactosylceramide 4-alpha-galactosyltransferase-like [Drosophila albomicans]|uniref:Lactosylceramide 4-alpha-galactosyltransferase-like n=1 Tax=Drosophila albomicans TaxID=7291 RepID=A0A6P8WMT2_DROAB|nr:lactosylceramide 4-alpha-galactosyltransferase-like [Drosophila albomicans]